MLQSSPFDRQALEVALAVGKQAHDVALGENADRTGFGVGDQHRATFWACMVRIASARSTWRTP